MGSRNLEQVEYTLVEVGHPETHEITDEAEAQDIVANITSFGTWIMLAHKTRVTFKRIKRLKGQFY